MNNVLLNYFIERGRGHGRSAEVNMSYGPQVVPGKQKEPFGLSLLNPYGDNQAPALRQAQGERE